MSTWLFPVFIFAVWSLWAAAAIEEHAVRNASLPEEKHGGVSVVPVIPLFPLMFWGFAIGIDDVAAPWGTYIIGSLHIVFGVVFFASFARACWRLRNSRRHAQQHND